MQWFFICLAIGFFVVEIASGFRMYAVWPSASAFVTAILIISFEKFSVTWQALVFILISVIGVLLARPLLKILARKIKTKKEKK